MIFKLEKNYPTPDSQVLSGVILYLAQIKSLLVYNPALKPSQQSSEQQPKKKIAFKADKSNAGPTTESYHIFQLDEGKWDKKESRGKIPSARSHFQTITMGNCLLLYGGKTLKTPSANLNDLYALNTQTWGWKKLFSLDGPPPCENCIFTKINESHGCLISNDSLWVLSVKDVKWELSSNELPGTSWQKTNLSLPQNTLFCCSLENDHLLIGGRSESWIVNPFDQEIVEKIQCDFSEVSNGIKAFYAVESSKLYLGTKTHFSVYQLDKKRIDEVSSNEISQQVMSFDLIPESFTHFFLTNGTLQSMQVEEQGEQQINTMRQLQPGMKSSLCIEEEEQSIMQSNLKQYDGMKLEQNSFQVEENECRPQMQNQEMKGILKNILGHEAMKRKILETKTQMLQQIIKKSEKFVLQLCKYGNQQEKRVHIEKVRTIRQDLEFNWKKEIYYRKEMQNRQLPIKIEQIINNPPN